MDLQEGQKAPMFTGIDQDGNNIFLKDFKGKKVVIFFYPKDDTPGCTAQACNLRDNYGLLKRKGFEIIGISPDDASSHKKFETKFDLPFTLIADPKHLILNKYGVWKQKKMFNNVYMGVQRTTFVLDEKGKIEKIFYKPKTAAHAEEIIAAIN
ncbi:MAG: thioredoxin-dependent thiol peroxidase [Chitinophagaceae bacterium]|jgi:peroxiredoxin Q/BCP|nr:thioredoxin-dependent thiol peroxidase [Chitinophagaceae bacterium]